MSDFPLARIQDFLRRVVPFDTLEQGELSQVVSKMEIAFFPRDEKIITSGGPPAEYLFIIMNGAVKVTLPDGSGGEILVDIRGEGDTFGSLSLLRGKQALMDVTAQEDIIAFLLPSSDFRHLVETHPNFNDHFSFSLARNIESARRSCSPAAGRLTGGESLGLDALLRRSLVSELMNTDVLTCQPGASISEAARLMTKRKVGSIVVKSEDGKPLGLFTDTDLRSRVVAHDMPGTSSISRVMTRKLRTISPKSFAFEAMLEMIRHGIHHLVVTEGGRLVGMISDHDLRAITGASWVGVVRGVEKLETVDQVELFHQRIDPVLESLLRLGGSAQYMLELSAEFNDRLTLKLLKLTEAEMLREGWGGPPVAYAWLALGSAGRREQVLRTPQENGIIYVSPSPGSGEGTAAWFGELGKRMVERLERAGLPRSPHGQTADHPESCRTEREWVGVFEGMINETGSCALPQAGALFDFRSLTPETELAEYLRATIHRRVEGNEYFLRRLARLGSYKRPPLGFIRQFVVEKSGEYVEKLDLRYSGLLPVVNAARVLALDKGIQSTGTLARLAELARQGHLKEQFASDLAEAFGFICLLRVSHHLETRAAGLEPDDTLDPAWLNSMQRKMLKDSFTVISELQSLLERRYKVELVC